MALEASFKTLGKHLYQLQEALEELQRTVLEKPLTGDVVMVDLMSDASDDLCGLLEEASAAATEGANASVYPAVERVRRALKTCQEKIMILAERLTGDLLSYERMQELTSLGGDRGGAWMVWSNNVKAALESCRGPLYEVNQALFECWQELTERIGIANVSVQATNVGQQITVPLTEFSAGGKEAEPIRVRVPLARSDR